MSSDGWHLKIRLLSICLLLTNVPSGPLLFFRLSYFLVAIELITYSGWSHPSWCVCRHVLLCVRTTRCASFMLCSFGCLFAVVSFAVQRLLNLMQFHLSILDFFFCLCFWRYIQKSLPKLMSRNSPFVFYTFSSWVHSELIFIYSTR